MNEAALWAMAFDKGLPFVLLLVAVVYFYLRDKHKEARDEANAERCRESNDRIMKSLFEMNSKMFTVADENAKALKLNAEAMSAISTVMQERIGSGYHQPVNLPNITTYGSGHHNG